MKAYGDGVEIQLHSFLSSALDGGEETWVPKLCSRVLFDKLTVMQMVKKL